MKWNFADYKKLIAKSPPTAPPILLPVLTGETFHTGWNQIRVAMIDETDSPRAEGKARILGEIDASTCGRIACPSKGETPDGRKKRNSCNFSNGCR